ncbi:hypothetical protein CMEL01_01103 [Colletotrichum melonis]|uniref:Uncharacterized protein n=1 Tax=Colletotrichum melonis TaxID=1209925 RepID=A0AAI9V2D7_9PEZI|nr:hypothetical protein CMEL01_01103 [Colletotrichum melonis]
MQHSQSCFCSVNTRKKKRVIPPDGLMNAMEIIDERGFKMQAEAKREVIWQDETQDKTIELKSIGCRHDV